MAIMVGVMAMLLTGFYSAIYNKNQVKVVKERVLSLQRLKLRFAALFKDVIDVKLISENAYYIKYKGGVDHNRNFRGEVEAVLKIKNNVLTLTCWPNEGDPRREVLSENVKSLSMEFFDEKAGGFHPPFPKQKPRMMKVFINGQEIPLFL